MDRRLRRVWCLQVGYTASGPWRRKLWAMALLYLLSGELGGREVAMGMLARLAEVLSVCVDLMAEAAASNDGASDDQVRPARLRHFGRTPGVGHP
jgi:hypothetical protein